MLRKSWIISLAISLFGVMLVEYFFTLKGDETSDIGGNLGAFGIALIAPFLLLSLFITFRYFTHYARTTNDKMMRTILTVFMLLFFIVVAYFAIDYRADIYTELGGSHNDPNSQIYGYPVLNEYTNRVFINLYTFFCSHAIAAFAGLLFGTLKPKAIENETNIEQ